MIDKSGLRLFTLTACSMLPLVMAAQAHAEETPQARAAMSDPDEIIVTANKRQEKLRDVAGSIGAVTGDTLQKIAANELQDYAATIPGVSLAPLGRSGSSTVTIRGIQTLSVGSATGTYIDDAPFGSANNFASGGQLTPDLDPADLERVEFLKGPQGTLYGASSLGGLIKYVTKAPDLNEFSARVAGEASFTKNGRLSFTTRNSVNVPLVEDKLALRMSGYYRRLGGYIDDVGRNGDHANSSDIYGVRGSLLFKPTERLSLRANVLMQTVRDDGSTSVDVDRVTLKPLYGDLTQRRFAPEPSDLKFRLYSGVVEYDADIFTVTSITSYSEVRSRPVIDYTPVDAEDLGLAPTDYVTFLAGMSTNKTTQELRIASPQDQRLSWMVGGFYQREVNATDQRETVFDGLGTIKPGLDGTVYLNIINSKLKEYAGFANLTYKLTPELEASVGYRHSSNRQDIVRRRTGIYGNPSAPDQFRIRAQSSKDTVDTYLATVRWKPTDDLMFYARASSGYRPGGPRDVPPNVPPPADFKYSFDPDKVWNYEAGARATWLDGAVTTDINAFLVDWKGIQALQFIPPFRVFSNAGNARIKGIEFQSTIRPAEGFSLAGNLTYTDSEILADNDDFGAVKGEALPYTAKFTGSIDAQYEVPIGGAWTANLGAMMRYSSARYTDFSQTEDRYRLAGYALVDLRLGFTTGPDTITLFARNIGDKRAYSSLNNDTPPQDLAMTIVEPRTIGINFSHSF